ncbi:alpha/beta fold hydrolase [Sorangium sp. So ce1151]|uniref:alpha/beta fold hydrolase n=1 Tax=Sorangium sp. So ce1151 TaxID=3133332 RepID=UPI003F5DF2FC
MLTGATHSLGLNLAYAMRRDDLTVVVVDDGCPEQPERSAADRMAAVAESYRTLHDPERWRAELRIVPGPLRSAADRVALELAGCPGPIELWHLLEPAGLDDRERAFELLVAETRRAVELAARVSARRVLLFSRVMHAGSSSAACDRAAFLLTAERELAAACRSAEREHRILRLGDVLGPFSTLKPGVAGGQLHRLISGLSTLARRLPAADRPLFVRGEPTARVPLIPIDALVRQLAKLREAGFPDDDVITLTADNLLTSTEVLDVLCEVLHLPPIKLTGSGAAGDQDPELSSVLAAFSAATVPEATPLSQPDRCGISISPEDFRGYAVEYVKQATATWRPERFSFRAADGTRLTGARSTGAASKVVLAINAVGMPVDLLEPLMRRLSDRFRVVTWETRGVPDLDEPFHEDRCGPEHHLQDILQLMSELRIDAAHLIGWCTGARLALDLAARHPERVRSLVLLNGSYNLPGVPTTPFERNTRWLMSKISREPRSAELFWKVYFGPSRQRSAAGGAQFGTADPRIAHLASSPFRSVESLRRFAHMIAAIHEQPPPSDHPHHRTLVVTATQDSVCDARSSEAIAEALPAAVLRVIQAGDHYELCNNPDLLGEISSFLNDPTQLLGTSSSTYASPSPGAP